MSPLGSISEPVESENKFHGSLAALHEFMRFMNGTIIVSNSSAADHQSTTNSTTNSSSRIESRMHFKSESSPVPALPSPTSGSASGVLYGATGPDSPKSSNSRNLTPSPGQSPSNSSTCVNSPSMNLHNINGTSINKSINEVDDDEDEVLSIGGREDEKMCIDDTSSNDVDHDQDHDHDRYSPITNRRERVRNYSFDDSSTKSPKSPRLNEELHLSQQQQQDQSNRAAALIFSIANILRPDFGLVGNPQNPYLANPYTSLNYNQNLLYGKSPLHHLYNQSNHHFISSNSNKGNTIHGQQPLVNGDKSSRKSENGKIKSNISKNDGKHHRQSSQQLQNPIDLSRPANTNNNINTKNMAHVNVNVKPKKEKEDKKLKSPSALSSPGVVTKLPDPDKLVAPGDTNLWPAWVYCTRYSDRPSSGPRSRRGRKNKEKEIDEKRPRTAFTSEQLARLKREFEENRYLTEKRRQDLANDLKLHENQIKIWFQNKRAKLKKSTGTRGTLALSLMAQGLYNHSTIERDEGEDSDE